MSRDRDALVFERLRVRRLLGIDDGYELADLVPGLNVIHGPNTSGKTTTARALESALWPRAVEYSPVSLAAEFRIGNSGWELDLEGQEAQYRANGGVIEGPVLPASEVRGRYYLSLHDLLQTDDSDLAAAVVRESIGGYDLDAAIKQLGVRERVSPSRTTEHKKLRSAEARVRAARESQRALQDEEHKLAELEARQEEVSAARLRVRLLEAALEYAELETAYQDAKADLVAFPPELAQLHGNEVEELERLRRELDEAQEELEGAEERLRVAAATIEGAQLPEGGIDQTYLGALRERIRKLEELERGIEAAEEEVGRERGAAKAERHLFEGVIDEGRLEELDLIGFDEIAHFVEGANRTHQDLIGLRTRLERLREPKSEEPDEERVEALEVGIEALREWLRNPPRRESKRGPFAGILASILLALVGLSALVLYPEASGRWSGIVVLVVGIILVILTARRGPEEEDRRSISRSRYEELGLRQPSSWSESEVTSTLKDLENEYDQLMALTEISAGAVRAWKEERTGLEVELARLETEWAEVEARRDTLATELGLEPPIEISKLYLVTSRINRWLDARRRLTAAEETLALRRSMWKSTMHDLVVELTPLGYRELSDWATLAAALDDLERRVIEHEGAVNERTRAEGEIERARRRIGKLEEARIELFERSGASGEDREGQIREWLGEFEAYQRARKILEEKETLRRRALDGLQAQPGYDPEVGTRPVNELRRELEEVRQLIESNRDLGEKIGRIKTQLENARHGHVLEDALADLEEAKEGLRELREKDVHGIVGKALGDYLRRKTREWSQPPVFERAQRLFAEITRGQYRLDFDSGEAPAFYAHEITTGRMRTLDQLSSATRVQLLLAVRLAFIESQEVGPRLPIVFDETLGNSDDQRAAAIMEATHALAATGRQIFYFTAQPDEVGKWRGHLEESEGAEWKIHDLAEVRALAARTAAPRLPILSAPRVEPPAPEGRDHEEYGELLGVPGVRLFDEIEALHLWHLVDDPELLHHSLRFGIDRWGALQEIARDGQPALLGEYAREYDRIATAARVYGRVLDLVRIGRGRPVDREALEASGEVSDTFMPRVLAYLEEVDHDAARLVDGLQSGEVPRFRRERAEDLGSYLEDHGYLDRRERLGRSEIRATLLREFGDELEEGRLDQAMIDRAIEAIGLGVEDLGE